MSRPPRRPTLVALLPVAVLGVAVAGPTPGPVQHLAAGWGLALAGAWATVLAHRRTRTSGEGGWRRVTRTIALWTFGQALFAATDGRPGPGLTLSSATFLVVAASAADVVFRSPHVKRVSVLVATLDAVAACLVLGALLWAPVLAPAAAATSFADAVPFPVIEVAVVALGLSVLGQTGGGDRALVAIVAATAGMLVGDVRYLYEVGHGGYHLGSPADALWLVGVATVVFVAASPASSRRVATRWWHQSWLAVPFGVLSAEALRQQVGGRLAASVIFCGALGLLAYVVRQVVLQRDLVALSDALAEDRDRLAESDERLRRRATHDPLTGLPNRAALPGWLASRGDADQGFGLVLLDVDRFKDVNDALGHPAGDELLRRVAHRLSASVRPGDLVAHLGGDEFVAVLPGVDGRRLEEVAARLLASLGSPSTSPVGRSP